MKNKCWKLFYETLIISACTFGGGFVIVSLLRKKFVEQLKWVSEEEMLDMTALAQSAPGPIAVNVSVLLGYRLAGLPGMLISILATVLPPFVIISLVSLGYQAFRDSAIVSAVMKGMQSGVAAVIADVVITLTAGVVKEKRALPIVVTCLAFAATYLFHVNVFFIILAAALTGLLARGKKQKKEENKQ